MSNVCFNLGVPENWAFPSLPFPAPHHPPGLGEVKTPHLPLLVQEVSGPVSDLGGGTTPETLDTAPAG